VPSQLVYSRRLLARERIGEARPLLRHLAMRGG
jgi:hypothetical protein